MGRELKVGEVARRTGVSVRALHYYEEIGLLRPERTAAGHRLFGRDEVARLQQIRSLAQLGFALDEVKGFLGKPDFSLDRVLELHIERLDEAMAAQQRLRARLEAVRRRLAAAEDVSIDQFLETIKETTMYEKHYTPEQLAKLEGGRETLGSEGLDKAQSDWSELIAEVRVEMEKGTEPTAEAMRALARRWQALIDAFTQGDPGITQSLANVWKHERPQLERQHGGAVPSAEMMAYVGQALKAL
jgi:DNA-binding transcriptional MerR regulator